MIEKQIAAVLEPIADELAALHKRLDTVTLQPGPAGERGEKGETGAPGFDGSDGDRGVGIAAIKQIEGEGVALIELTNGETVEVELPRGEKGDAGERGSKGADGLGIETKAWAPGIYREGAFVTTAFGRIYKALTDTAGEPGRDGEWQRVGSSGFAWKGLKQADATYEDGDLYIDGGSTFVWWAGKGRMFAQRGAKGDAGPAGKDGRDGVTIVAMKADADGIHMALSDGEVLSAAVEGLDDYIDAKQHIKLMNFIEERAAAIEAEGGTEFSAFHGQYIVGKEYAKGSVVVFARSLYIARKATGRDFREDEWRLIYSGSTSGAAGSHGLKLQQLDDVNKHSAPALGEMPIWSYAAGSSAASGQFTFRTPNAHIKNWDSVTNWESGAVVFENGQLWRSIANNNNVKPAHEDGRITLYIHQPGEPTFGIIPMGLGANPPPTGEQPLPPSKYAFYVQYTDDTHIQVWKFVVKGVSPITHHPFGEWEGRPWQCIVWRAFVRPPAKAPPGVVMVWIFGDPSSHHAPILGQQSWASMDLSNTISMAVDVDTGGAPKDNMILVYNAAEQKWKAMDGKAWVAAQTTTP